MAGLLSNPEVIFKEDTHQYFSTIDGEEYKSVSKVLSLVKIPFDRDKASIGQARQLASEEGISFAEAQKKVWASWDKKRDDASDHGDTIHNALEDFFRYGKKTEWIDKVLVKLKPIMETAYLYYPEALLYNHMYKTAGQSDLVVQRQKGKNSIIDFYDYKTNLSRGIYFDSISRKNNELKHYSKYFLPPLEHFEECNYNLYALQLSIYAYMAELTYGIKVGRLAIIYISPKYEVQILPVPYLKLEAKILLDHNSKVKSLPKRQKDLNVSNANW